MGTLIRIHKTICAAVLLFVVACQPPSTATKLTPEEQQQASAMYAQAEQLLQDGQIAQAQEMLDALFTQYPNANAADNALLRLGQIQANQKEFALAQEYLEQLTHTFPESDIIDLAYRDLALVHYLQKDCDAMMHSVFEIHLDNIQAKDQAKLSKRVRTCMEQDPSSTYELIWNLKTFEQMDAQNPLYAQTQQKIIQGIEMEKDQDLLVRITSKYKQNFPAGYASYRMISLSQEEGNKRKTDKWTQYFQKQFPLHPKSEQVFEVSQTLKTDHKVNPNRIGVLLPLSGAQQQIGQLVLNGLILGIGTLDRSPDALPYELIVEDTQSNPSVARARIKKLIFTDHVAAVIGPLTSAETESVADIAETVDLPLITMSPKEGITSLSETTFRNSITKKEQAIALAQLTNQVLNIHRVAILYPETSYGQEFMEIFWREFESYGGKIHGAESFAQDQTHYARPIQKLVGLYPTALRKEEICSRRYAEIWHEKKKTGQPLPNCFPKEELPPIIDFEAVLIPDGPTRARQILPALKYHDVRGVQILGTNLWNSKTLLQGTTGSELEGALFMDSFYIGKKSQVTQDFVQRFYAHFGYEPSVLEAQAYDTIAFLIELLQESNIKNRQRLVEAMLRKDDFEGVTGLTGFGPTREAIRNLTALMVSQDKIVELY